MYYYEYPSFLFLLLLLTFFFRACLNTSFFCFILLNKLTIDQTLFLFDERWTRRLMTTHVRLNFIGSNRSMANSSLAGERELEKSVNT